MPLYEYSCQQCHRNTEKRQKFSDPEITECPHCGGHLERVLSAPNIAFKGGGWYKDLYSSPKPAASGGSEGDSAQGKSEGGAATDSSSKAAASGAETSGNAPASTPPAAASSTPATTAAPSGTKS